jgi:hypothetical protein
MWPPVSLDGSLGKPPALVLVAAVPTVLVWVLAGPVLGLFAGAVIATLAAATAAGLEGDAPRRRGRGAG